MRNLILTVRGDFWGGGSGSYEYNITEIPTTFHQVKAEAGDFESIDDFQIKELETVITEKVIRDWSDSGRE